MKETITSLSSDITSLRESINRTRDIIYATVNQRKAKLLTAIEEMKEAQKIMGEFITLTDQLGDFSNDHCIDMDAKYGYMSDILDDINVFISPIEKYDGICEYCGKELSIDEQQFMDEDSEGWMCAECERWRHPEREIDGQMSIEDINETKED